MGGLPFVALVLSTYIVSVVGYKGTTPNLREIMIGRCHAYDSYEYSLKGLPRASLSCDEIWDDFLALFKGKAPCNTTLESYMEYVLKIQQVIPPNKAIFYQNVYQLVRKVSDAGRRFITLEDTIAGYLGDKLSWCGKENGTGIDYDKCPDWGECSGIASENFWISASINFAKQASGHVYVLLKGTDPKKKAYRPERIFGKYELSMMTSNVTKITVFVAHELGKQRLESCGMSSLVLLENDVRAKGFEYECKDDPPEIMHILCSENPTAKECGFYQSDTSNAHAMSLKFLIVIIVTVRLLMT